MRNTERLRPRLAFLDAGRRVRLYFVTGSAAKFAQAEYVFDRLGLPLAGSLSDRANEIEDYYGGALQLIEQKLRDISLGRKTVYFVEDTYVRIEALSQRTNAQPDSAEWARATVPGLKTKDWFENHSFQDLNSHIQETGGDRRASVYSTIGLHIPGVVSPQVFTGHLMGSIANCPGEGLPANRLYPWLSPDSFNAWFVPIGETTPLSDLDLERSLDLDFRVSALLALADRLEEYMAILNLPSVSIELVPHRQYAAQSQLFPTRRPPVAVIGLTCAGKTTFGEFLSKYDYEHIEASSILRILQGSNLAPNSRAGYFQAITTLSSEGWDIIARRAIDLYERSLESGICITGLRTVEELEFLARKFPDLIVVLVEAPAQMRFERYMNRDRAGDDASLTRFREREHEHASFGLISIADHCATVQILNDATFGHLEDLAKRLAQEGPAMSGHKVTRRGVGVATASRSVIYRCAQVLAKAETALSPTAIELGQQEGDGLRVVKRNVVRKTLAEHPLLVRRVGESDGTSLYELTDHGQSYLSLIDALRVAHGKWESEEEPEEEPVVS